MEKTDTGQRYRLRATGWPKIDATNVGFFNDAGFAFQMACGLVKAPGCTFVEIEDREKINIMVILR
jgi:hypothetical protein